MSLSNFERMMQLVEEVFATKEDPDQLDVNEDIIEGLQKLHPAALSEYNEGDGPIAWILLIPTTQELMHQFVEKKISEKELYELTKPGISYDALYLCSGLVLEEYRRKGIAKDLTLEAVKKISEEHSLKALFVWSFSKEGDLAAEAIARHLALPLFKR